MRPRKRTAASPARALVASIIGVCLLAVAYQASFAGVSSQGGSGQVGILAGYGTGFQGLLPAGSESSGGSDGGGSLGLIAAPVGVAGAAGLVTQLPSGGVAPGVKPECEERLPELPADAQEIRALRVYPPRVELVRGTFRCFHLEAQSARDGKWYSVTQHPNARLEVEGAALVRQDGAKNVFCFPLADGTALAAAGGAGGKVIGTFSPTNGAPVQAEALIQLRSN